VLVKTGYLPLAIARETLILPLKDILSSLTQTVYRLLIRQDIGTPPTDIIMAIARFPPLRILRNPGSASAPRGNGISHKPCVTFINHRRTQC
jgi:hypothetical protein